MKKVIFLVLLFCAVAGYFTATMPFDEKLANVSGIFVVLFALPSFYFFCKVMGFKRGLACIVVLSLFAVVVESLAVKTGFPYGSFYYTGRIGYKVWNLVPWTVPFAWVPLVMGTYVVADRFVRVEWCKVLLSALLLVLVDMVIDPGAVALKFWIWKESAWWYGVPLSNFVGWWLSGVVGSLIMYKFTQSRGKYFLYSRGTVVSLVFILVFWSAVVIKKELWMVGGLAMGLLLFIGYVLRGRQKEM